MAIDATQPQTEDFPSGEALSFHGPGWTIGTDTYEVTCWAPGPVEQNGRSTRKIRTDWLLAVELRSLTGKARRRARPAIWEAGGFVTGATLADVLPALALLDAAVRRHVTEVLISRLDSPACGGSDASQKPDGTSSVRESAIATNRGEDGGSQNLHS